VRRVPVFGLNPLHVFPDPARFDGSVWGAPARSSAGEQDTVQALIVAMFRGAAAKRLMAMVI